jgi:hypothetical protein
LSAAQHGAAQPGAAKHGAAKHGAQHGGALTPSHSASNLTNLTLKLPALATALHTSFADVNANYDASASHQPLRSRMLHPGGYGVNSHSAVNSHPGGYGGSQMQIIKDCMGSLAGSASHDGGVGACDGAGACGGGGCGSGGGGSGTRSAPPTCSALKRASYRQRVSAPVEPAGADGSYEAVCEDFAPDPPNHFIAEARGAIAVARAAAAAAIQPKGSSYSLTPGCLAAPPARAPAFAPHGHARLAQTGELGSPSATTPVTAQVILTAGANAAAAAATAAAATAAGATAATVAALAHPPLPHATGHLGPKMARGPVSRKPPKEPWSLEAGQQGAPRESQIERQIERQMRVAPPGSLTTGGSTTGGPVAPPVAIEGRAQNLAPPRPPLQSPPQPPLHPNLGHQPPPQTPYDADGLATGLDGSRVRSSTSNAPTARAAALATAGEIAAAAGEVAMGTLANRTGVAPAPLPPRNQNALRQARQLEAAIARGAQRAAIAAANSERSQRILAMQHGGGGDAKGLMEQLAHGQMHASSALGLPVAAPVGAINGHNLVGRGSVRPR